MREFKRRALVKFPDNRKREYLYQKDPFSSWVCSNGDEWEIADWKDHLREDYPEVIFEDFTGLKDKNGKEIYEGDKLQWTQNGNTTTGSVKFAGGSFYVENFYFASQDNPCDCFGEDAEFKVIGNIHETLKDK